MIRRPPRSTLSSSSAASDVYKRQGLTSIDLTPLSNVVEIAGGFLMRCTGLTTIDMQPLTQLATLHFGSVITKHMPTTKLLLLSLIHISEPTRLLSISYAVFCLKKKKQNTKPQIQD
eukprot:TRINITY_DN17029_c0_g1_i1.p1 TRINITY_DN17029_c0_g1~~TRINITY_DN17029_c0_g1_i1.p1  ORF type:complete len:117 (-),score=31.94 TRINITY_DN17029_c0_g1_i1:66-416(-)